MEARDFLAASQLLIALRADGCTVATEGGRLVVEGRITDTRRAAIIAQKPELLALLAAEGLAAVETVDDPTIASEVSSPVPEPVLLPEPASPSPPLLPRGPVVAGVAVMTPEMFRWRALRDDAVCRGVKFDLPPPRYRYPEFETKSLLDLLRDPQNER